MARNIAADDKEAWRAVLVFKRRDNQELHYEYEGIYAKAGTAKARITFWRNAGVHHLIGQYKLITKMDFYDGWTEKAEIIWDKVKD